MALRDTRLALAVDETPAAEATLAAHEWTVVAAPFTARERARVRLSVRDTVEPDGDPRALGVAVRSVAVNTESGTEQLPLARDRDSLLSSLTTEELAEHLDREAVTAGAWPAILESLLKGPASPSLVAAATKAARRADLVLATNAPFVTMAQGLLVGRMARRPVVLLPFLHLRDAAHHRWTLRHVLSRADRVLCLSHSSCRLMERLWGTRARFLGGGVDPQEFTGKDIDAERAGEIGLVNHVYPDRESALEGAQQLADEIACLSPLAVQGSKQVMASTRRSEIADGLRYVALWNSAFLFSDDLGEALASFMEKRKPDFTGG